MFGVGVAAFFLLLAVKIPDISTDKNIKPTTYMSIIKNPAFFLLILMCGFYYIPEHGLQNWLTTYASEHLGFTVSEGSFFTGLFYAFMTVGRLIFAVLVNKLGPKKSLFIFSVFYSVLYIVGVAAGKSGMYILCAAGLGNSVLWPTFIYLIQLYYPPESRGKAVGLVTGLSTFFDIGFNALFGALTERIGFAVSIYILPAASVLFLVPFSILVFGVKKSRENRKSIRKIPVSLFKLRGLIFIYLLNFIRMCLLITHSHSALRHCGSRLRSRNIGYQAFSCQYHCCNGSRVLECGTRNLCRINDSRLNHIHIGFIISVETVAYFT